MEDVPFFRALMRPFYAESLGQLTPEEALADVERLRALLDAVFEGVDVPPGGLLVDVATGAGLAALAAARRFPHAEVRGFDLAVEAVEKAQAAADGAGLANARFGEADAEALPLDGETADVVTIVSSFNLFPDKPRALAEARRVLRRLGTLVVAEAVAEDDRPHAPGPGPVGERALRRLLEENGFRVEAWTDRTDVRRALDAGGAWRYPKLVEGFRYVVVRAVRL